MTSQSIYVGGGEKRLLPFQEIMMHIPLFSSEVPFPFRCVYAKKVKDYSEIEKLLHDGLASVRDNLNREFFRISENEVINFLKISEGEGVTPREDNFQDHEDEVTKQSFQFSLSIPP